MSKPKTNVEFMVELMEFSRHGALMQLFVMAAIEKYAEACKAHRLPDDGIISPEAWEGCANEVLSQLEERYK